MGSLYHQKVETTTVTLIKLEECGVQKWTSWKLINTLGVRLLTSAILLKESIIQAVTEVDVEKKSTKWIQMLMVLAITSESTPDGNSMLKFNSKKVKKANYKESL